MDPALVAAHFTLIPEGDPHPEANDSDIVMNEVCFLNLLVFMVLVI